MSYCIYVASVHSNAIFSHHMMFYCCTYQWCMSTSYSNVVLPHHAAMFYYHIMQQCCIAPSHRNAVLPHHMAIFFIAAPCSNAVLPHCVAVTLYLTACLSLGNIRVFCRVRPPTKENGHNGEVVTNFDPDDDTVVHICHQGRTHSFQFDRVFSPDSTQAEV